MEMLTDRKGNIHLFDENNKECLIHPEHIDEVFDFLRKRRSRNLLLRADT